MSRTPYNEAIYNVGNSIFPEFNDKNGLMLCGYEFGYSNHDQYLEKNYREEIEKKKLEINTFYNKSKIYDSPYDHRIIKWFGFFGHPLGNDNGCSPFDKSLLQTNWCNGQGTKVRDYDKFLFKENYENFLSVVEAFLPSILIFLGANPIFTNLRHNEPLHSNIRFRNFTFRSKAETILWPKIQSSISIISTHKYHFTSTPKWYKRA